MSDFNLFDIRLVLVICLLALSAQARMPESECHSRCDQILNANERCTYFDENRIFYRSDTGAHPTLLFFSGTGYPTDQWFDSGLATDLIGDHSYFAYDRIYTFNSCPGQNNFMPNTARDVVERLQKLLKNEGIHPPYILVGHSFGGLYALMFAKHYPNEVSGLLLFDPSSSEGPTPLPKAAISLLREKGNPQNPAPENPLYNEIIGQLPSYLQLREKPAFDSKIPLVLIASNKHCLPNNMGHTLLCMTKAEEENHLKEQEKIAHLSDYFQYIVIDGDHDSCFEPQHRRTFVEGMKTLKSLIERTSVNLK